MFELMKKVVRINTFKLIILGAAFYSLCAFIIYYLEPDNFENPFLGFWWVMTTVTTVGFGDYFPVTNAGKVFGMFLYLIGIGLFGIVLGKTVDFFISHQRRKEDGKLNYNGKNHYVIIGWSTNASKAIDEIWLNEHGENDIVLIDQLKYSPIKHENLHYVNGNATDYHILDKANVLQASSVTIFASEKEDEAFKDGKSLLIASAIESYSIKHKTDIYTIVEMVNYNHKQMFKHVKVDEFILSSDVFPSLVVNSMQSHGSSHLLMQLLSKKYGDNLWIIKPKASWNTYWDALENLRERGANLLAAGTDLGIMKRLDEKMLKDEELYIICDKETFESIESD